MNNSTKDRAIYYFRLGDQYCEVANILLHTLIDNGNSNTGFGITDEEAITNAITIAHKSDLFLFIPALFNILQSTELFTKGLLLLNNIEIDGTHEIQQLLDKFPNKYVKSNIYQSLRNIYFSQESILKEYRNKNHINNAYDLYESLRYPESKSGKKYEYHYLLCNGNNGIKLFTTLYNQISEIKFFSLKEYHRILNENGAV